MEPLLTALISLGALAAGWLLRAFIVEYAKEKGKNLATREDMSALTHLVEGVKTQYAEQLERTKSALSTQLESVKQDVQLAISARNRYEDTKAEAYVDLYRAMANLAIAQRSGKEEKEYEASAALMDAKARVAVYGSRVVTEALADFFADHSNLSSPIAAASFLVAVQRMRSEAAGSHEVVADSVLSSFFFNSRQFASAAPPEQSDLPKESEDPMQPSISAEDLQDLNSLLDSARHDVLENYKQLLRNGNPPGMNTMQISFISYMAAGVSSLGESQLAALRKNGILRL
jgi:hypothetical protein